MNFKEIHIGSLINQRVIESGIEMSRICNFLKCSEGEIMNMYELESIDSELLLRWCKLLEYDFFRIYSQHLILYAPLSVLKCQDKQNDKLPVFKKNLYTPEVIDFVLELIKTETKTKNQIIEEYKIPKSTLYKWINKYKK